MSSRRATGCPLDAGSGGHVLMAFAGTPGTRYDQIRRDGYCVSRGERDPDVVGIGAPVFGSDREPVGALLLSASRAGSAMKRSNSTLDW